MHDDIEQIKKLPAEERLRKLKELTKKREEEIKAAQTLMKKSESELTEKRDSEEKIPIPQMISEHIQTLTTDEERDMFKVHRQMGRREEKEEAKPQTKQTLEEAIETEKERVQEQRAVVQADYARAIELASMRPVHELYAEMARIKTSVEQQGYISREQMSQVNYIARANELKAETGYKPEHAAAKEMTLEQKKGDRLQGMYRTQSHAPEQIKHGYKFEEGDTQYTAN